MYNFLSPKLLPKVSSMDACMDDYEAANLIHENPVVRARGFLAYTSIKPPVNIDFELICPISIRYITINTRIGNQKAIGIEVLAKTRNSEYTSIAQAYYSEDGVTFANSRFYSNNNPPNEINRNYHLAFLKSNTFRSFINANIIRIRILRTNKSVPCLGPIEIWGIISKSCSKTTSNTIHKLLSNKKLNEETAPAICDFKMEFNIPDDFKDALTYDVMTIPMTLPSGHTIDQSTLEKCISNDASYGRQGSDPFTGVRFTDSVNPVMNVALKSRIDMFLIQNSDKMETFKISRTIGRKRKLEDNCYVGVPKTVVIDNNLGESASNSLEDAIAKVVSSSTFISFTKSDKVVKENIIKCLLCQCDTNLYVLPCTHLYCRLCLLNICNALVCKDCGKCFVKNDVKKFHK